MKVFCINFGNKLSLSVSKPIMKSINDFIFGILKSNSSLLSEIARALKENIKIKDTIDRLSKNLEKIYMVKDTIYENYYSSIKKRINDNTFFHVDNSDVNKNKSTVLEDLDMVKDGSSNKNELVKGYWMTEVVATNGVDSLPISLYSRIFSTLTKGFKSINDETFKAIKQIVKHFGKIGTYVMDRGYDDSKYFEAFLKSGINFIIRGKKNRNVVYKGRKTNIVALADSFKGKINVKLVIKGKELNRKCSYADVIIPSINKQLTVIFVYFKNEVAIFYTNKKITTKKEVIGCINGYYMRWRIEEYFKYRKQQFGFENYRVRSLAKMNALVLLLNISIACISLMTKTCYKLKQVVFYYSKAIKNKVYFEYYRITDGIYNILAHIEKGIRHLYVKKESKRIQLSLFDPDLMPL
jgi:hypothetical protein